MACAALLCAIASGAAPVRADEGERKISQQVYDSLVKAHKLTEASPYAPILAPIAKRLAAAASGLYDEPFRFFVVKDKALNAFAVPGGYMFVNEGTFEQLRTKDELAGVMCHEMNHVIHHDGIAEQRRANATQIPLLIAGLVLRQPVAQTAIGAAGYANQFATQSFSRHAETNADLGGADLCARAGYNPHGLIWVMEALEKQAHTPGTNLEMLSDHPRDDHRIADLEAHLKENPERFARYPDDKPHAVPLVARDLDGTSPLPYVRDDCPRGAASKTSASEARYWVGRTASWLTAPGPEALGARTPRAATDRIDAGEDAKAAAVADPEEPLDALAVAYDPSTYGTLLCETTPGFTRVAVVGATNPPPFAVPRTPLELARTTSGIALLSPAGDLARLYGPAEPVTLADGSLLYRYTNGTAPSTAVLWFRVQHGAVIAFGRDTTY